MPDDVFFQASGAVWGNAIASTGGMIAGAVGGKLSESAHSDGNTQLAAYLKQHGPEYGQMYFDAMREQLKKDQRFLATADATHNQLRLTVLKYGLHLTPGTLFGAKLAIAMQVKAELLSPAGDVLWSKQSDSGHVKLPSYGGADYLADPAKLTDGFRATCEDMAERLIHDLDKKSLSAAK